MTLVYEETLLARLAPGLAVRDLGCSEFREAMRSVARIISDETPASTPREHVEREMRKDRNGRR